MAKWKFNAGHLQTSPNFRYDSFVFPIILELLLSPFRLLVGGDRGVLPAPSSRGKAQNFIMGIFSGRTKRMRWDYERDYRRCLTLRLVRATITTLVKVQFYRFVDF
jgi:hypothetical protein